MTKLSVPDMSCGHCKAAVEKAIEGLDPTALVEVDLETRTINVDAMVPVEEIVAALTAEGYPATPAA